MDGNGNGKNGNGKSGNGKSGNGKNGNETKAAPERVCEGDCRVRALMRKQRLPAEGERVRKSRFAFTLDTEDGRLLFHTLTRQLLILPPGAAGLFDGDGLFPRAVLEEELPARLYEEYFLVPENSPESRTYLELKDVLALKEERPKGFTHFVILPTSACNARCFYCYERGMRYQKMSAETVEDTLRFILRHKPENAKKIHIHWFGGEPMCAPDNIDRICAGLTEAGIAFSAEMTSNGSLFTRETAEKAAQVWKIGEIQITLDGMAEEYARRKQYASAPERPFETVIRNMHLLIAAGIRVTVRLNTDENNLEEIARAAEYLGEEFTGEEKKKLRVYAHSLYALSGEGPEACPAGAGSDALEERVAEINEEILRRGLARRDLSALFTLKTLYCMAAAPENSVVIDAAGQLYACEAMPEGMRFGDVRSGPDPKARARVAAPCAVRAECEACVFLPQCTEFDRCPNRSGYDSCFRQEKRRLESELRHALGEFRDRRRGPGGAEGAGRKEASNVSD